MHVSPSEILGLPRRVSVQVPAALLPAADAVLAGARRGEPDALARLYCAYAGALTAAAARMLGSRADAEDVVQDLFVGLPEALARYEERGQLGAWLRRLVVRLALGRLRAERRRGEVSLPGTDAGPDARGGDASGRRPLAGSSPADTLVDRVALERAVAALPEPLRLVFLLREVEGYAHHEIAALLGITRGASEMRLFRAVRRLRALLA